MASTKFDPLSVEDPPGGEEEVEEEEGAGGEATVESQVRKYGH